jgi:linoleoyl-CoA desaturase
MAMALDLLGGSSFIWKWKHNILHHTYPNMLGVDADVDIWPLARVSEEQPRYRIHRFQCWYIWGLYALLPLSWYVGDLKFLVTRKLNGHSFPRPRGADLAAFLAWKAVFIGWAIVLPLMFHPLSNVILVWLGCSLALGLVLSIPFQVAHCVTAVGSIRAPQDPQPEWAIHQVQATANFAPGSRWLTWYLGGLNFQIEHHLFPSIAHIHYPRLSPVVRQVCGQFGVQYAAFATLGEAVRSHFDWLRQLGMPPSAVNPRHVFPPSIPSSTRSDN